MKKVNVGYIMGAILGLMIIFGCDSRNDLVNNKVEPDLMKTNNTSLTSSVDSNYSKFYSVIPIPSKNYSYQNGISPTMPTTANPATNTATDGQDIHIYPSGNPQSEVHISISLANPDNLLVSANTTQISTSFQGYYYSNDGGVTWYGSDRMPNNAPSRSDPTTAFDASGNGYLGTLGPNAQTTPAQSYLIQKTTDGGSTWLSQVRGAGPVSGLDKEMIAADNMSSSPYANNLYAAWSINPFTPNAKLQFNKSTDGGQTFSTPATLKQNNWVQGANVQTGSDGNVYVCWANYSNNSFPANGIGFARSTNGGASFGLDDIAFSYTGISSSNQGNSTFGNTRINDFPTMAVDKSGGSHNGRIYIAYPAEVNGKAVIKVRYSSDQGNNWSTAQTISIGSAQQSWFPWIAVDQQKGWVSVDYYVIDGSNYQTDTYLATSFDGGQTWQNAKASDVNHTTAPIPDFGGGYAGDYIGIAAYGGTAYPTWMDDRNGTWQIYVSPVTLSPPPPPPPSVSISGPYHLRSDELGTWTANGSSGSYQWYYQNESSAPGYVLGGTSSTFSHAFHEPNADDEPAHDAVKVVTGSGAYDVQFVDVGCEELTPIHPNMIAPAPCH